MATQPTGAAEVRVLQPEPLTRQAFSPFGDVIEADDQAESWLINDNRTRRFNNLAHLDLEAQGGEPSLNIFVTQPVQLPLEIRKLERHPLSSQAFMPLSSRPYLVIVAPAGELDESEIRVFLAGPHQGVNYAPGTWHHYSLALGAVSEFLVVDRLGPGENCDEQDLSQALVVELSNMTSGELP